MDGQDHIVAYKDGCIITDVHANSRV